MGKSRELIGLALLTLSLAGCQMLGQAVEGTLFTTTKPARIDPVQMQRIQDYEDTYNAAVLPATEPERVPVQPGYP